MTDAAAPALSRWQEALIERLLPRTPRVISVFLRAGLGPHEAGQHIDVRLTAPDGYQAQRSYSIASAPGSEIIELAIERLEDGEVSPYFHDIARPGDAIEVRGPIGGHFIWRGQDGGPLLLVAGGSGIVPLMAMLRHRTTVAPDTRALLVYSARNDQALLREILAQWRQTPRHIYVCGSNAFVEAVTTDLVLEAIPASSIRAERFGGAT